MKTLKKIFSLFNLLLFIGSFCFTSFNAFGSKPIVSGMNGMEKQYGSWQDAEAITCTQSVFEKSENENENGMQTPAFVLPFFLSLYQFKISQPDNITANYLVVFNTNPIYLSVCDFRI